MRSLIKTLAVALGLSLVPLATIAPSVAAWEATVQNCETAGQSSQVFNAEQGYEMLLFQDSMQPRYTFGYGWNEVAEGGEYLVRWTKDGKFHPDSDTIWVKECPPLEKPDPIINPIDVTCVAGQNGIDTRVQVDVTYNTRHTTRPLPVWVKVRIDDTLRMDQQVDLVKGWSSYSRSWHAGQGEHYIKGFVRVGPVKKYITRTVHCDVVDPRAKIPGPFEDPEYFAKFINTRSTVGLPFTWRGVSDGEAFKDRTWVMPGMVVKTDCKVLDPGTTTWVNVRMPTGKLVRLFTIEETAPLDVYPPCPVA